MFPTLIKFAFRNILRSRIRSLITLVSVSLILTLYTVLTSISDSFTKEIEEALSTHKIDIAVQARYAATPVQSRIPVAMSDAISLLPFVESMEAVLIVRKRLEEKGSFFILGVSDYNTFADKFGFNIIQGKRFNHRSDEIVIGHEMARILKLNPGDDLVLGEESTFRISGVYSGWLNFLNAGLIIDLNIAQKITGKERQSNMLFITLEDELETTTAVEKINQEYPDLRAIESTQLPQQLGPLQSIFVFSKIVSLLTLVIASAVLANVFVMASNERTRETGILKAIGWSRMRISSVYFIESFFMCLIGGLIGFLLAYPMLDLLRRKFTAIYMYLPQHPEYSNVAHIVGIAILVSVTSTVYPLIYTSRLKIAKALQHD